MSRFTGHYPPDWTALAKRLKDDAGWRCVRCGHSHEPSAGYCLTVHHADGDKSNNAWYNTLVLCQRCHLHIQASLIPDRPWLFEHTAWYVPYVCGFYAWHYGGLVITREQAEREPERWLALGQPWRAA
jgi:hypothetical protein